MRLGSPTLASSWLGIAAPFWSALTILPLDAIGRQHLSRSSLQRVTFSWMAIPSTALFAATLSSFYPVVAVLNILFVWKGIRSTGRSKVLYLIGGGLISGIALLFNFSFLSILMLAGFVIAVDGLSRFSQDISQALWTTVRQGALYGAGVLVPLGLYWLMTGHSLTTVYTVAMSRHLGLERAYFPWLVLDSWDFILFLGIPTARLTAIALARWRSHPMQSLIVAWACTILVLLFSGTSRGEVGRVWMLLMPSHCSVPPL